MIHQCNVCQRNKLYFQTNDYCSECKVFICSGCLKTWEKDNNKCPICHKITKEDTEQIRFIEQTIYESEDESILGEIESDNYFTVIYNNLR